MKSLNESPSLYKTWLHKLEMIAMEKRENKKTVADSLIVEWKLAALANEASSYFFFV